MLRPALISLVITFLYIPAFGQKQSKADSPAFSRQAVYAYSGKPVLSPDGTATVRIRLLNNDNADDFPALVLVRTQHAQYNARINFALNAEILWSPDSKAFTVSGSRDGAGGLYQTDVFQVGESGLTKIPMSKLVWQKFGHPVRCGWPESPNVGAVKWLGGSERLVVAAQIIGHSNCDSFSTFKAYEIEVSSKQIVGEYGQIEAKSKFSSSMGDWLKAAPDECIRNPKACRIAANHQR